MERRSVRIAVFAGVFIACLLLSARCTTPNAFLGRVVEAQLEKALGHAYTVDVEKVGLHGVAGARVRGMTLTSRTAKLNSGAPVRITVDRATVGVSPFELLGRRADATARIELGGGRLEIDIDRSLKNASQEIEVRVYDVNLTALPVVEAKIGLPLSGVVRGTVRAAFDESGRLATGNIDLNVLGTQLGPGALPNEILPPDVRRFWTADIAFPAVDIGDLLLRAPVRGSQANIETFRVVGEDLRASGEGRILLGEPLRTSQIQATLRMAVEPQFIEEADLGSLLGSIPELRGVSQGGEVMFTLSGAIARPQVSSRRGGRQ